MQVIYIHAKKTTPLIGLLNPSGDYILSLLYYVFLFYFLFSPPIFKNAENLFLEIIFLTGLTSP